MTTNDLDSSAQMQRAMAAGSLLPAITLALMALAMTAVANAGWFSAPDWPALKADIRKSYPEVRQMSDPELQKKLAEGRICRFA